MVSAFEYRAINRRVFRGTAQPFNRYFRLSATGKISAGNPGYTVALQRDWPAHFTQSMYAAGLLHIPSLCLAKLSVSLLLRLITPNVLHNRLILGVEVTTVLWALTAELVAAFQCHLPTPWKFLGNKCFDRVCCIF